MNGVRRALVGRAGPTWVALHGYPDTHRVFEPLASAASEHLRMLLFDWPGQGKSERTAGGPFDPWDRARFLARLLDDEGMDRVSLVAHDMGVLPALAFAALFPARTERLVLAHALIDDRGPVSLDIALLRRARLYPFALTAAPGFVFDRCRRSFLLPGHALAVEHLAEMRADFRRTRRAVVELCRAYDTALPSFLDRLGELPGVPVDLVWSTGPGLHFPIAHARALAARVQNARIWALDPVAYPARHWAVAQGGPMLARIVEILRFGA